jgi:thiol-disulfide isomerase/thioredoxin
MKLSLKIILLFLVIGIWSLHPVWGQSGYEIQIILTGKNDSTFFLANYYGEKFFISDTSTGKTGNAFFKGENQLKQGIYILANEKKEKVLEFLVGEEQFFTIALDKDLKPEKAVINGSQENRLFFEHISIVNNIYSQINEIQTDIDKLKAENKEVEGLIQKVDSLNKTLTDFRQSKIKSNPELLFSKILLAMQEPEITEEMKKDKDVVFKFYKSNYWNSFDLSDERLLMTPLLPKKLETYFSQLVLPLPDSIIKEIDELIALTKGNQIMSDYLIWHFVSEYQTPKIMGLDQVFVHLADRYFENGKVSNLTTSLLEKITDRANKMRNTLIGNIAPDLMLIDTSGNFRSFREIESDFTVIIFWDQTCSHCKKEMEVLDKLFTEKKYDLKVYAVNSTNDFDGWKQYLREKKYDWIHVNGTKSVTTDFHDLYDIYSVPVIYILDKSKKIIGKRIGANQIEGIIQNWKE